MHLNPELCFADKDNSGDKETDNGAATDGAATVVEGQEEMDESRDDIGEEGEEDVSDEEEDKSNGGDDVAARDDTSTSDSNGKENSIEDADPLKWVFNRMSHMVVHKGEARRRAVFGWFLAMAAVHEPAVSIAHLKIMLLPLRRAVLDAESGGVEPKSRVSTSGGGIAGEVGDAAKDLTSAELATEVWILFFLKAVEIFFQGSRDVFRILLIIMACC